MIQMNNLARMTGHTTFWYIRETMQKYSDEMKVYLTARWAKIYHLSVQEMSRRLENAR
jgi:predicted DNA-binding protein